MDIEELDDLIKKHGGALYGFCHRLAGNKADTDDLYQETFLKAMELRHRMNSSLNPKAFLLAIAARLRKNSRRKWAWRQRIAPTAELNDASNRASLAASEFSPEEAILSGELRGTIQAAAATLDDKLKVPLYMHYTADLSIDEIAEALGIPPGTVKSRLYKARKAIKSILEAEPL
ncbi:RNA polymerase sigma factor [Paenibacillus ginsengarvi]|uniref:RNA polymerase sigma factor n=1 Tax=Paenibacillus ginsengarvi TaxID=400777 RepID=A0A3B0CKC3_9BACL|nr:RNA polymerase sigma factor [Paenibacillus ginsengarvi]RKN85440.1 RNA polymerase sigma factor [Paenibacillus ginsengarvi]